MTSSGLRKQIPAVAVAAEAGPRRMCRKTLVLLVLAARGVAAALLDVAVVGYGQRSLAYL